MLQNRPLRLPRLLLAGLIAGLISGLLAGLLGACSDEKRPPPPDGAHQLARERVAAHVARDERSRAREVLRPLVEGQDATAGDLLSAAAIELTDNRTTEAAAFLDRAAKLEPKSAAVAYLRGQMARDAGESKAARDHLKAALALAPDDLPTMLALAESEDELDNVAESERLYRKVVEVGPGNGQQWYVAAVYRLSNLLTRAGPSREAEARRFDPILRSLEARGLQPPNTITVLLGELGRVKAPPPKGTHVVPSQAPLAFRAGAELAMPAGTRAILARDVDGDLVPDLIATGPGGVSLARNEKGQLAPFATVSESVTTICVPFDLDNDGDLDLFTVDARGAHLFAWTGEQYEALEPEWPALPAGTSAVIAVDYDHEGDLDLALATTSGVKLWRNDSALDRAKDGTVTLKKARFADATAGSGLSSAAATWIAPEDYDGDNDVDFLAGGPDGIALIDSLRDGKFAVKGGVFDLPAGLVTEPLVADFDGDARPDLWFPGVSALLVIQGQKPQQRGEARVRPGSLVATDLDLDGSLDVAWLDEKDDALRGRLALGLPEERALALAGAAPKGDLIAAADFDGDHKVDLALAAGDKLRLLLNEGPTGRGARFAWRGLRDNRRAVGAIVEVRAGRIYRRIDWRGEPEVIGVGDAPRIDVLRVTWPNGVVTTRLDVEITPQGTAVDPDEALGVYTQGDGQVGSCPFLYTWNGRTFTFVSDVLGITPLGLRMTPDMFVPPDHDEYVLVTGEQLVPKDGEYVLQFTEELREVTYLDHARLLVVDSPAGTEVYPNERFQFPPFPEHHVHTVRGPVAPKRAVGSDGRDCLEALRAVDDVFPQPMELHAPQFAGFAKPWFVELEFDKDAVAKAAKLRLLLTGWFYWSDASANMAAARSPGVAFVPPMFQVPDGKGGWRDTGPPVGFPAGKTKTMIVDLAPILDRADPRIRVTTTLRLYWDRIVLATDADDAPIRITELACSAADAWRRGFSDPLDSLPPGEADPANKPERFAWEFLARDPRWNQHPGLYTRYGECRELVDTVDDRFVILGAGDALTLRFKALDVPALASGMRRDFLVYLDGWAKDRDPNTIQALEVEPLPFHAMSGYPYRADEHFPDTEAHRAWRRDWQTRPAYEWIAPVSPRREVEQMLGRSP